MCPKYTSREGFVKGYTAQKMKFSMKDFSVNETESAVSCGFVHIY